MKKNSEKEKKSSIVQNSVNDLFRQDCDRKILIQINKRKEENEALKKLLSNLNNSLPNSKTKKTK